METRMEVKPVIAIKRFLELDAARPAPVPEFRDFWVACSLEERASLAESAARQLGLILKED